MDHQTFEDILDRYEQSIFSYVRRLVGNQEDAKDLTQDIFLKVYRKGHTIDPDKNFKSWLFTVATNTVYDWFRRQRHEPINVDDLEEITELAETNPIEPTYKYAEGRELAEHVDWALTQLKPVSRTVILLYYREELSYEEIATALEIPINTVKTHLHRSKQKLKELLAQDQ